ncbi:hypothetical protein Ciccas_004619 [Cichlidogyrus casuarinus]|uniref:Elongation of very long chain fatty acids protein n=1 Tax=Cichlidogyrus casuarinus TaxID=1844966 RepID=A0ABD2QB43_9PLAT
MNLYPPEWKPRSIDSRVKGLFKLEDTHLITGLLTLYLLIAILARVLASSRKRKPVVGFYCEESGQFNHQDGDPNGAITRILIAYDFVMLLLNSYVFIDLLIMAHVDRLKVFSCPVQNVGSTPLSIRAIRTTHFFWIGQFAQLSDTVFCLLRGKFQQVTLLHVCYRFVAPIGLRWFLLYSPISTLQMLVLVSSATQTLVYSYYALAAFAGPKATIWWKKHISQFQLLAHLVIILGLSQVFWPNITCIEFKLIPAAFMILCSANFLLLVRFYCKTYIRKSQATFTDDFDNFYKHKSL